MSISIQKIDALEILDSRGQPTVKARIVLSNGIIGTASVPSGASTGKSEALELRDRDPGRYHGLGCLTAVSNINTSIRNALINRPIMDQHDLDHFLIDLDGTENKSRLGANAILAVSLAYAKSLASHRGEPLYRYFSSLVGLQDQVKLPGLTVNLFSGGKHAGAQVPVQDVLVVPARAKTVKESLHQVFLVYRAAVDVIKEKYQNRWLTADEGGLAPPFPDQESMFKTAQESIEKAGFVLGKDINIAIDAAASHFYQYYGYHIWDNLYTGPQMISQLKKWVNQFHIVSIEDGLAEDDWSHWPQLNQELGDQCLIMGDDLLCTNVTRIKKAIRLKAANALLLKVNQIGTLSEASLALQLARKAGWKVAISARSGETEDSWLADLAVGWAGDYIKVGSITQSERLAKYNRLLEIEKELEENGS
jgi:enolase